MTIPWIIYIARGPKPKMNKLWPRQHFGLKHIIIIMKGLFLSFQKIIKKKFDIGSTVLKLWLLQDMFQIELPTVLTQTDYCLSTDGLLASLLPRAVFHEDKEGTHSLLNHYCIHNSTATCTHSVCLFHVPVLCSIYHYFVSAIIRHVHACMVNCCCNTCVLL